MISIKHVDVPNFRSLLAMSVEDRVRACLSPIHGLGLFAVQQILRGDVSTQ